MPEHTAHARLAGTPLTLRKQVLAWLGWPLLALWSVSSIIDYDIANRFEKARVWSFRSQ